MRLCFAQATVVPHVRVPRHAEARLIGIELPRMNVEHCGNPGSVVLAEGTLDQPEWKMTQIRAARSGESHAAPLRGRERQLGDRSRGPVNEMRKRCRFRVAVAGPVDWKEARVVAKPLLDENVERPLGTGRDREVRGAETPHGRAGMLLENRLGDAHIVAELVGRERVDAAMPVAVRRALVYRLRAATHQKWVTLGHSAQREKRGARLMPREQGEQDANGMLETARL